jgi:hypothetical protein
MSDSFEEIRDMIADANEEALLADGFEDALIGYVEVFSKVVALYDKDKCIEILMKRDKMDLAGASEFFEFNVQGAYVGERTPAFATILRKVR